MIDVSFHKLVNDIVDSWADEKITIIEKFVDSHRSIVPQRIGIGQFYSMQHYATQKIKDLYDYIKIRQLRANKNKFLGEEKFFDELYKRIGQIEEEARTIAGQYNFRDRELAVFTLTHKMIQKFIQQVIAHGLYLNIIGSRESFNQGKRW